MLNRLKRLISPVSEPEPAVPCETALPAASEPEIDIGLIDIHQSGWLQNDTGELVRGFAITAEDVVLDIGCGEGGYALFSARQGPRSFLPTSLPTSSKPPARGWRTRARAAFVRW